jgi:hypothetical protein
MKPFDVVRKILCVLPVDKYGHIVMVLHQGDLSTVTPTQFLGKINSHEMYMHITPEESSSSTKKKDLAFKASQDRRGKEKLSRDSSSDDEIDDVTLALMVRRTTKLLKKLHKHGVKFDGKKKKFFTSSKRKPVSEMDCCNCGKLGHLAHQCPEPPKNDKFKKKGKGKKDDSSDNHEHEKKKKKPYKKKDGKKKEYQKNKNDKAYIVGDWLTDIESSSGSSYEDSDHDKVATIAIESSSSPPPSSSSTNLCPMAKGDRKVQSSSKDSDNDNERESESEDEFEAPSYDELVKLLNKYSKIIMRTRSKNENL